MAKLKIRLANKESTVDEVDAPVKKLKKEKQPKIKLKQSKEAVHTIKLPQLKSEPESSINNNGISTSSSSFPTLKLTTSKKTHSIRVKPSRSPGDGYDSEDPEREDDPLIEEGIILRMIPDESLDYLQRCVEDGDLSGINIKWKDKKRAIVRINGLMYGGKLIELPTVTEIHKSIDKKNIFKTIDICQMLLIVKRLENEKEINDIEVDMDISETHPDGLTPPMEGCKSRFKRSHQDKVIQSVEDRVEELLMLDEEAETSAFEFIDPQMTESASNYSTPMPFIGMPSKKSKKKSKSKRKRERELLQQQAKGTEPSIQNADDMDIDNELDRLMGEDGEEQDDIDVEFDAAFNDEATTDAMKPGQDEDEEDEDEDEDEEEEEGEEIIEGAPEDDEEQNESSDADDDEDDDEDEDDDQDGVTVMRASVNEDDEVNQIEQHNAILREEISEMETTIQQKVKDLAKANNSMMRNRINDVITKLKQELEIKKNQIKTIEPKQTEPGAVVEGIQNDEDDYDDDEGLGLGLDDDDDMADADANENTSLNHTNAGKGNGGENEDGNDDDNDEEDDEDLADLF